MTDRMAGSTPATAGSAADRPSGLVGRADELDALGAALDAIADGSPRFVGVLGDPGIGKPRLLMELATIARRSGRLVVWGRAAELERHVPFGMFTNALEDHLAAVDADRVATLGPDRLRLLRGIFPSLPAPHDGEGAELIEAERYRLHRAVRSLLEVIAQPRGLVLVLDDVHWTDSGSAELLDHLLRHPPNAPVLVAIAYRPRQTAGRFRHSLWGAFQVGTADLIEVGPLTADETAALLPAGTAAERQHRLHELSGGNPFYLEVLARGGGTEPGSLPAPDSEGDPWLPAPVRAALTAELLALDPAWLRVAHAAAVTGDVFDADLVAPIAQLPLDEVLIALDELADRDLVRSAAGSAGRFRFRHPLLRWATYQHAGAGWRLAAHTRAGQALRERGAPLTEQAHHVELSASRGDLAAIQLLQQAAIAAMHATPAASAHWLQAALRLLPTGAEHDGSRVRMLGMRAQALGITGRMHESREALGEVLRLLPMGAPAERAAFATFRAALDRLLGRHAEARALLLAELERLPDQDGPVAGMLKLGLASGGATSGPAEREWVAKAVVTARLTGERRLVAAALGMSAVITQSAGMPDEQTMRYLDEAAGILDTMSDAELAQRLDCALWLGWGEMYAERLGDSVRHLERALRVARSTGQSFLVSALHVLKGVALGQRGNLVEAAAALDNAKESALLTGNDEMTRRILAYQCWIQVMTGDVENALMLGERAVAETGPRRDWNNGSAEVTLALARYLTGDPEGCAELLVEAGGGPDLPEVGQLWQPMWYELLSAAAAAVGQPAAAAAWAERASVVATAPGLSRGRGFIEMAQVHPVLETDPARALPWAEAAAASFARAGDPINQGRATLLAAVALGGLGEIDRARHEFTMSRRLFADCGANLLQERAIREERRMNARQPRRVRAADAGAPDRDDLTDRERSVVKLLVDGLTNRQIADQLHLSPKTVEAHLSRVYAKLGVSSRAAVAGLWSTSR